MASGSMASIVNSKAFMQIFPTSPRSEEAETGITTEHLALVGFAARLGQCVENEAIGEDVKSVREEARLLMSLLSSNRSSASLLAAKGTGKWTPDTKVASSSTSLSGSNEKVPSKRGMPDDERSQFSFTFPSLSLDVDDLADDKKSGRDSTASPSPVHGSDGPAVDLKNAKQENLDEIKETIPPSKLFSRPVVTQDQNNIMECSEAMARNVLRSFGAALEWRAMCWIQSLAQVLALKETLRIDQETSGTASDNGTPDNDPASDEQSSDEYSREECDGIMESKEARVIESIVESSEKVTVLDVRTRFQVVPKKVSAGSTSTDKSGSGPIPNGDSAIPPTKKARTAYDHEAANRARQPLEAENEYKVARALTFEAKISMLSNLVDGPNPMTVTLTAPGTIQGTFMSCKGLADGEEILSAISISLDTDMLANSMERQSRLIVRNAAEASLLAMHFPPSPTSSTDQTRYQPATSFYSEQLLPPSAVVTPRQQTSPSSSYSTCGSEIEVPDELSMPPPAPRLPFESKAHGNSISPLFKSPRRVSPGPLPSRGGQTFSCFSPRVSHSTHLDLPSALVTPQPMAELHQEEDDENGLEMPLLGGQALPALLEVANAAMCAS